VKIVEKSGKKLVFGLEWRLLVNSNSPSTAATQQALTAKAPLMWHDGKSPFAGLMPPATGSRATANGAALYAAAIAFKRLPGLPPNALLVLKTPDDSFAMVGISGGRPRRGFDHDKLSADEVRQYYEQFGNLCGDEGFALVGDADLPFIERITQFTLDELATLADSTCVLKVPSRKGLYKALGYVAVAGVVGAVFVPWWLHAFFPKPAQEQQKDPAQQYQEFIQTRVNDPVVPAQDYVNWYGWVRSLSPSYGGWTFQAVDCSFHNKQSLPTASYIPWDGKTQCKLTYARTARAVATNESFMKSIPADWRGKAVYDPTKDSYLVSLEPTLFRPMLLRTMLHDAGLASDRDVHFMSQLQRAGALTTPTGTGAGGNVTMGAPAAFLTAPGMVGVVPCGQQTWAWASWHIASQLRYVELLSQFPAYTTITTAGVSVDPSPAPGETPFKVDVTGEVITRNPVVACLKK
jgi:hypothetical protein